MNKVIFYLLIIVLILSGFVGCEQKIGNNIANEELTFNSELDKITNEELLDILGKTKELEKQIIYSYDKEVKNEVKFNYNQSYFEETAYKAKSPYETVKNRMSAYGEYYIDPPRIRALSQSGSYNKGANLKNELIEIGNEFYIIPDLNKVPTLEYIDVLSRKVINNTLRTEIKITDKNTEYNEIIYFILDSGNLKIDNRIKNEENSELKNITDKEILEVIKKSEMVYTRIHSSFDMNDKIGIENETKDGQVENIDLYKTVSPYDTPQKREDAISEFFIDVTHFSKEFNVENIDIPGKFNTLYEQSGVYYFYPLQLGIRGNYSELVSRELIDNKLKVITRGWPIDSYSYKEFILTKENDKVKILDSRPVQDYNIDYKETKSILIPKIEEVFSTIDGNYSVSFKDINEVDSVSINSKKAPAASTIKIYVMVEAYNQVNNGRVNLNDTISLNDSMKVHGSGKLQYEPSGTKLSIEELIKLMMVESDNTAANIMIDKLGMDNINSTIKALGGKDTELNRKMMDLESLNKGIDNYTSTDDLTLILSKLYNGQAVNSKYDNKMLDIMKGHQLKSKIPNKLPEGTVVAHKSGEMGGIENDAAIVYTDKGAYILCILTDNGKSEEQVMAISDISREIYNQYMEYKK